GSIIIANPASGPGTERIADYAQGIEIAHDYGQTVIGYVDTSYGLIPLDTVKAQIDDWYSFYNGDNTGVIDTGPTGIDTAIDGIFLDQMANFPAETVPGPDGVTVQEYYSEIYAHMQTK